MKKFFPIAFCLLLIANCLSAQNIGIGTTSPNAKALLDISSTTRGVLLPRMTTDQRTAILSPPEGLLVYDTDISQFYHYDGTTWRKMLNSTYWTQSTTRNRIYNLSDSIGIGTSAPSERLDVSGNIRGRNNINADNDIKAGGNIIAEGTVVSLGNLLVAGNSQLSGTVVANSTITAEGDIILNNAASPTIQLKTAGVNKGFLQLAGDNIRIGTNSGNTNGKLVFRNNGADRMAVDADGRLTTPATGDGNSMIPLCYGVVNNDGVLIRGTDNVTVEKIGPGGGAAGSYYKITCPGIALTSIISATADTEFMGSVAAKCYFGGTARVYTFERNYNAFDEVMETKYYHDGFTFVIYK